jgi:perosamine synthetase
MSLKYQNLVLPSIDKLKIEQNIVIHDALKIINKNSLGICFVVNRNYLLGVVTDGDIRRALIKGVTLKEPISIITNKKFISLKVGFPIEDVYKNLDSNIKVIPIVDKNNILIDFACDKRFHSIVVSEPNLKGNEYRYVLDCLKTGWISSIGKYVSLFEKKFSQYVKSKNAVAVSSGTTALHLATVALGIKKGDEVIIPSFTFVAPLNAILYAGATPVLVDINKDNLCIDESKLLKAITKKTRAIIIVHIYGFPLNMENIKKIAKKYNLLIIEDCAEALGSKIFNKHVGTFGDAGTFSFFGNKTVSTGEGGMIIFKESKNAQKAISLRGHAMSLKEKYWHDDVGYNYRLTNIQAAIGLAQMERIKLFVNKKIWIAKIYRKYLSKNKRIILPLVNKNCTNSYWLYFIRIKGISRAQRNQLILILQNKGIEVRKPFFPLGIMSPYLKYSKKDSNKIAQEVSDTGICLPSHYQINKSDIINISNAINSYLS